SVPGELQHAGEPSGLASIALRTLDVLSLVAQHRVLFQHNQQEPTEPHALTASLVADTVHPIVPIAGADKREPVRAILQRTIDGANRMLENRGALRGDRWQGVHLRLLRLERRRFEKWDDLVERSEERRVG